jgi:hypothetical protein
VLNAPLHNALARLALAKNLGDVTIVNEDKKGTYDLPQEAESSFRYHKETVTYADVPPSGWGECYHLNCPGCGDTRRRLFVSHLWGHEMRYRRSLVRFSRKLYVCHNEHCRLEDFFAELSIDPNEKSTLKPERKRPLLGAQVPIPAPLYALSNDLVPVGVLAFLAGRDFDPLELERNWGVCYMPRGASYNTGRKQVTFHEDRLWIPVHNRRRLAYWQARVLVDTSWQKRKYMNAQLEGDVGKAMMLYNMDRAWRYTNVTLVEGITDVWRIGDDAVALLGTTLHRPQLEIMKVMWGHCGSACVCLDGDAVDKAAVIAEQLRKEQVFPDGVSVVRLDEDADPADYTREEIRSRLGAVFSAMEQRCIARAMAEAFVDDKVRQNFFQPAEVEGFN